MSAQRRSGRKRAANTRINDLPDSSPIQKSQPAAKKRKANPAPNPRPSRRQKKAETEPQEDQNQDQETEEEHDSNDDSTQPEENPDLTAALLQLLDVSAEPVRVAETHENHEQARKNKGKIVEAYAKICGREWTYYVSTTEIFFGRGSEEITASTPPEDGEVDVDLGPSRGVSRRHAKLFFDSDKSEWHVMVLGRNGVKVNDRVLKRNSDSTIISGDVISIAGTQMLFQAAGTQITIHPTFQEKLKRYHKQEEEGPSSQHHAAPFSYVVTPVPYPVQQLPNGLPPIAPLPEHGPQPVTPVSSPKKAVTSSTKKRSPGYKRGIMMESTEQIDYSVDSSKDIKPGCSYSSMITWAIMSTPEEALSLSGIYSWIKEHYAYYRLVPSGWQNSIRHNLSLNASFGKVARRSDEPGKGMKWKLVPEHREATIATANKNVSKGGGRTSSAPGSPAGTGLTGGFPPAPINGNAKPSSPQPSPPLSSYPPNHPDSFTPNRGPQMPVYGPTQGQLPVLSDETSPLARRRHTNGHLTTIDSSPTLTSGPWTTDGPMRTPAPRPYNLNVPQPNTIKLPTSHMPESSPAPFWKYAGEGPASTPASKWPDTSPVKKVPGGAVPAMSSSPPPPANGPESPTRRVKPGSSFGAPTGSQLGNGNGSVNGGDEEEEEGIDLMKGFTKISSYPHQHRNGQVPARVVS